MKRKLADHFGSRIVTASINGKADVVTFRSTASTVLREFEDTPKQSDWEEEKLRIVQTAADLIKNDIKCKLVSKDTYPFPDDVSSLDKNSAFLPQTLRLFLRTVSCEKGRPEDCIDRTDDRSSSPPGVLIVPIMLGIAVQLHRHFGSKFVIDSLNSHGFCSSYSAI